MGPKRSRRRAGSSRRPPAPPPFAPETTKKRASGEYARISCVSERTSGRPSPVSAAKKDTTDENGDKHIHLLDAETRSFVSSNYQLHVNLF